jgi:hypothetical protein
MPALKNTLGIAASCRAARKARRCKQRNAPKANNNHTSIFC